MEVSVLFKLLTSLLNYIYLHFSFIIIILQILELLNWVINNIEGCPTKSYTLLISNKLINIFFTNSLTFNSTHCENTHEFTLRNNKKLRIYKTFNNTMYAGAAQADVTTAAVNVIVTYYSFLKVYTLMCIKRMISPISGKHSWTKLCLMICCILYRMTDLCSMIKSCSL